ncbi:MAG: Rieske 2Fe-2S domain-containing protein [Burkholderiales bacterium]
MTDWKGLPFAPPPGTVLCTSAEVVSGQGKEVVFGEGHEAFRVLLLRAGKGIVAYHNCCPHFSLPLNYEPGEFHIFDGDELMCAHHTAMFRIADGDCFDGPCKGASLTAIPVRVAEDGSVKVAAQLENEGRTA